MKGLREKVGKIYESMSNEFYLCRDDIKVTSKEGEEKRYNSALLFGILTELNRGKELLFGEYGGGKTTSAEILHSVFYGLPLELVKKSAIRADPQKTEEKMTARPNYGKLYDKKEEVVWQHFVLVPGKIIDEFNRLPEPNQSLLLDGVDRGEWSYLNDHISTGREAFFATCNYADRGNGDLIPPMLDRFDVAVESKFPGVANAMAIAQDYENEKDKKLSNPEAYREAIDVLNSGKPYEEIREGMKNVSKKHREFLRKQGIETLEDGELLEANEEIKKMPIELDASRYLSFLIAELNVDPKYGQKRSNDKIDMENGFYLGNLFEGSGSRREEKSIVRYSKAFAWLLGDSEVNIEHMTTVAPYVLWHRMRFTENAIGQFRDDERDDPLVLHITKRLVGEGSEKILGVKKRYQECREMYITVMNYIEKEDFAKAKEKAEEYAKGGKGHPIFTELARELS